MNVVRAWGVEEEEAEKTSAVDIVVPIVKGLLDNSAIKDVEVLRARAKNAKAIRDRFPPKSALWLAYDNRYQVLSGKLRAAMVEKAQEQADRRSKLEFVTLGKTGVVVGIAAGAALVLLLLDLSGAARRHGRR